MYCIKSYRGVGTLTAALLLFTFTGCDLLEVENPGALTDEDLEREELVSSLSNTAEGNITDELSGLNIDAGMLADEVFHPSTQLENVDFMRGNRLNSSSAVEGNWEGLAQSRWLADEMVDRLTAMVADPGSHMGVARSYFFGGMARLAMADHFNVIVYGPEDRLRSPITAIEDAIERFEQAAQIAGAAGDANYEAAALGQIARSYRSLYFEEMHLRGNTDPSLFVQAENYARQALQAHSDYNVSLQFGAPGGSNGASGLGGPFGGVNRMDEVYLFLPDPVTGNWDPRVPHEEKVQSSPISATAWNLKYAFRETPLGLSRAAESMLIIAEARLLAGDLAGAVEWINRNRAAARVRVASDDWADSSRGWPPVAHTLSDLRDFASSDADAIYAQLKHERRAEFFLELRRWQDMRYYEIVPERWFQQNKDMGMHLRWPPAPTEIANNPNLTPAIAQSIYLE